jgi:hypothetical protein
VAIEDQGVKPFAYDLTELGRARLRSLDRNRARSVVRQFRELEEKVLIRLREISATGLNRVVFYGAGEIMEVALPLAREAGLELLGVVDDDVARQGLPARSREGSLSVACPSQIEHLAPDCVVITTYRHADAIRQRLSETPNATFRVMDL